MESVNKKVYITTFEDYSKDFYKEGLKKSVVYRKAKLCPWIKPDRSLFLFTKHNKFRLFLLFIVGSKIFEGVVLTAIVANCVVMAMGNSSNSNDTNSLNYKLDQSEIYFVVFFLVECILKVIAYGFVLHKASYLRNGWNCLDFSIVVIAVITYILSKLNLSSTLDVKALRAFRVLRALRLLSSIPSLQVVMNSVILALKPLGNIAALMVFLAVVYSIVGMNLFMGRLHSTCYNNVTLERMDPPLTCRLDGNTSGYFCTSLPDLPLGQEWQCMDLKANASVRWPGPNDGITNFDNMLLALLTVFQLITKEGWTTNLYAVNDAIGTDWAWVYFVSLVIIIVLFVLNLILGVLSGEFSKQSAKVLERNRFIHDTKRDKEKDDYIGYKHWIETAEEITSKNCVPAFFSPAVDMVTSGSIDSLTINSGKKSRHKSVFAAWRVKMKIDQIESSFEEFRKKLRNTLKSRIFFIIVLALVFLNAAIMATEFTNQPQWLTKFQQYSNIIFVVLFAIELILKLMASGLRDYFNKIFNIYDFIVVVASIIELGLNLSGTVDNIGISVLRCARILRIFKLTKYWKDLSSLVKNMIRSLKSIVSLLTLIGLLILIFALLGMQVFGGKFNSRPNFDSFFPAVFTVFQILTGDDWNSVMYSGIKAMGGIQGAGAAYALYFIILFIMGNCILLNVFLAIVVENLRNEDEEEESDTASTSNETHAEEEERNKDVDARLPVTTKDLVLVNDCTMLPATVVNDIVSVNKIKSKLKRRVNLEQRARINIQEEEKVEDNASESPPVGMVTYNELYMEEEVEDDDDNGKAPAPTLIPKPGDFKKLKEKADAIPTGSACFIFVDTNKFRIKCHEIVNHTIVKNMILVCIVMSSIMLAMEDPTTDVSGRNTALNKFDYFFTGVFALELLLKMVAYGVILHKNAFLRDKLNWIDLIVVVIGIVINSLPPELNSQGMSAVKTLRVLRVLRPLRAINRIKGLKHVLQCVIVALRTIWKIMVITFLLEFMFAVIGVIIMKGAFYSCNDANMVTADTCVGVFSPTPSSVTPRVWSNNPLNYDNVGNGMLTLFTVASFSGWISLLYTSIDAVGENLGPQINYRQSIFLFYFVFIVIVAFVMINIFVGMVIVTFQKEGDAEFAKYKLDKNKRQCIDFALKARPIVRYVPNEYKRYKVWRFVCSKKFENFIVVLILLNTVCLAITYMDQPKTYSDILTDLNMVFTVLFTIECFLKMYAFGFRTYFNDGMNIFDVIVISGSYVDIIFAQIPLPDDAMRINLFRLFRIMRLIRLLNKVESMRRLLWTFIKAFRSLPYVTMLFLLTFFIYSVMGMQFFGKIGLGNPDSVIDRNNNFQTFFSTLLVLTRCITGENWQQIMMSCIYDTISTCNNSTVICGTAVSYFYFTSFVMICSFLIMNLFVAVIIDNFDYLTRDNSILGAHHLENFITLWSQYDTEGRGQIMHLDVVNMLCNADPPLGFGKMCPQINAFRNLVKLNLPLQTNGTVLFNATLFALVRKGLKIQYEEHASKKQNLKQLNDEMRIIIKTYWKSTSPLLLDQIIPPNINECVTIGIFQATSIIENWYKKLRKNRQNNRKKTELLPPAITDSEADTVRLLPSISTSTSRTSNEEDKESDNPSGSKLASIMESYERFQDTVWTTLQDIFTLPEENLSD